MPLRFARTPSLRRFWERLDARRDVVDAAVLEAAQRSPSLVQILERMTPEVRDAQARNSAALQRAALVDGEWDAYLADLRAQGIGYAELGVPFEDWFALLAVFRSSVVGDLVDDPKSDLAEVLEGMNAFVDQAMSTIGAAYLARKEDLVRRAERRLQLYVDLVDRAPWAHLVVAAPPTDDELRVVIANPAARRLCVPTRPEPATPELAHLVDWLRASGVAEAARQTAAAASTCTVDVPGVGDDARIFEVRCHALDDEHVAITLDDVTQRRRLRERIDAYVRDLERSNHELDEFAYVASHDLKAPLQDISNLARWVAEDVAEVLPADSARHLEQLLDRVTRMERLLDDLLEYSRVGRAEETPTEVSLWEVVEEVVAFVGAPEEFVVETRGPSLSLCTPRAPLHKILRNLLHNAIKHHDRDRGHVCISARPRGDRIAIRVADDGPGVPPQFHARVFRMFQTLRPRDRVEGSGLGLALVKKTVEHYGGRVEIESSGRGTAIEFTWPAAWPAAASRAS